MTPIIPLPNQSGNGPKELGQPRGPLRPAGADRPRAQALFGQRELGKKPAWGRRNFGKILKGYERMCYFGKIIEKVIYLLGFKLIFSDFK
jgi:hypothetical protein